MIQAAIVYQTRKQLKHSCIHVTSLKTYQTSF